MTDRELTVKSERLFEGTMVSLRVDTIQLDNGLLSKREIVEHHGSVAIVPIDMERNVIMVRQYRKAVEQFLLEIPAGGLEIGEHPEACARRELQEETGCIAGKLDYLARFFTAPGFCNEEIHTFLATKLTQGEKQPDFDENIDVVSVPLTSIAGMIAQDKIRDAKSIAALMLVMDRLKMSN